MKKFVSLLLALAMALSLIGCKRAEPQIEPTPVPEESAPDESLEEVIEEEEEPAFDWSTVNPLTGEPSDIDYTDVRPVAVMLNNIRQALPQHGNSQADLLYEVPEEGGITRIMGVYQDLTDVGTLGTVRSTRPYYVRLALSNDAILVHAGGSGAAYNLIKQFMDEVDFDDIDFLSHGTNSAESIFYRDRDRLNSGYASEHTLFTNSSSIQQWIEEHPDRIKTDHRKHFRRTHTFVEDGTPALGVDASSIYVSFSGYKGTGFDYDAEAGTYGVSEFDKAYVDGATGNQVHVENVIIIQTDIKELNDAKGHISVFLTGEGDGYYACNGKMEKIHWVKEKNRYTYSLFDENGEEVPLGIGKSFICVLDKNRDISINGEVISEGDGGVDLSDMSELSDEEAE